MKEYIVRISVVCCLLVVLVAGFALATTTNADSLSNEKLAWGFRRGKNNEQPVLDVESLKTLQEYNGYSMGNKDSKKVYITFDAGYEAGYTEKILETLKKNNVTATFFITAHYLNTAEDLVMKMIKNGNIVGNHTVNHKCLVDLSDEEIKKEIMDLHTAVLEKTGYEMTYFRPPKGEFSARVLNDVQNLCYKTVLWSNAYDDWDASNQGRVEYGKRKILDNLHNGCIILLHSTSEDNMNMLDDLIKSIKEKGYEISSLKDFE